MSEQGYSATPLMGLCQSCGDWRPIEATEVLVATVSIMAGNIASPTGQVKELEICGDCRHEQICGRLYVKDSGECMDATGRSRLNTTRVQRQFRL